MCEVQKSYCWQEQTANKLQHILFSAVNWTWVWKVAKSELFQISPLYTAVKSLGLKFSFLSNKLYLCK